MSTDQRNWAGNYTYTAAATRYPQTVQQVRTAVMEAAKVRALGTRHSFNSIADTAGEQISTQKLDKILGIDATNMTVTAEPGVTYGRLGQYLHERGYGLANLASLPHISVAGACATATHGSGDGNGNLATAVTRLEIVTAEGEVVALSRENRGDTFDGMVVALGALGIVTKITLKIVPTYIVRQAVYENLPFSNVEKYFEEIVSSAYSVSLFTDWQEGRVRQVWRKCLSTGGDEAAMPSTFFGAALATTDRHPISLSAESCTTQRGIPGPWYERLPHFRLEFTPSSGEELQSEFFVPRQHAVPALRAMVELRDKVTPHLLISEVRTIAADGLWMSPCYKQASVGIHFTWKQDWPAVQKVLPLIEERLVPLACRPHWGKLFTMPPERIAPLYEKLADFRALCERFDPRGKFRNEFVDKFIFCVQ
jgi:xylitol oxidase